MPTNSYVRDKVRVTPLTIDEAKLISLLSTEERKSLLLKAAKERAQEAIRQTEGQKVS